MKKLITLALSTIVFSATAQKAVVVTEGNEALSDKVTNAMTVMVHNGDMKDVDKAWKKQLKELKGKISDKKEVFADDCKMKEMGDNTFDLYSKTEEVAGEGVKLIVGVDLGGAYLSSADHPEQFKVMRDFIYNFGVEANKAAIGIEIEAQEKILKKLQGELEGLEKDDKKLDSDIADYKEKIQKAEVDKLNNSKNRNAKAAAISAQQQVVDGVKAKQAAVK